MKLKKHFLLIFKPSNEEKSNPTKTISKGSRAFLISRKGK